MKTIAATASQAFISTPPRPPLNLYNSFTNQKELFKPLRSGHVNIYSCGPTVYNTPHIGNYRSFLFSDLLYRLFKALAYQVTLVMNITDIDNKTIAGAQAAGESLSRYTHHYEAEFLKELKLLNFLPAKHYPRASEHVAEMVTMIETLIAKGHAYCDDGSVYFKLSSFAHYGKLSGIDPQAQQAGASKRIQEDEYSRDTISDFALWKAYQPSDGNVFYETSLGKGRPGWHIECSAMGQKYLGNHFDIHTGGIDNKFPHHENEIAQSVCATNTPFVNYWLHAAHLMIEGEKMSKSLGNITTLNQLSASGAHPMAIRYMLLSSHYRHTYNFSHTNINAATKALQRLKRIVTLLNAAEVPATDAPAPAAETNTDSYTARIARHHKAFMHALCDDLNTAAALAELFELSHALNPRLEKLHLSPSAIAAAKTFYASALDIFGFDISSIPVHDAAPAAAALKLPQNITELVAKRQTLRAQKDFTAADALRQTLAANGYIIIDTETKTIVKPR